MHLKSKLDTKVRTVLDSSGVPWDIEQGRRHYQLRVNGRLISVLPKNGRWDHPGRDNKNLLRDVTKHLQSIGRRT